VAAPAFAASNDEKNPDQIGNRDVGKGLNVNAFALPGAFFVNAGLILKAGDVAELAGVMAHEIAHVAARHGTRQATRGELINYGSLPLIFIGGWTGFAVREAAGAAIPLGFLKFSRGMEAEADMLGLEYMYKAGYDPTAFVDFFEKIEALDKDPNKPTLRRAPHSGSDDGTKSDDDQDSRPTLKRRD
jgi:predicted Zn-dependent protease